MELLKKYLLINSLFHSEKRKKAQQEHSSFSKQNEFVKHFACINAQYFSAIFIRLPENTSYELEFHS